MSQDTIERIPISEWKRRYGEPGGGGKPDQAGRIQGFRFAYFATEPDYCEDDTKEEPCRISAA